MTNLVSFATALVGNRKPGKDNYVEIRVNPQFKQPFTARLWRGGKCSPGYSGTTLDEALHSLDEGEATA